MRVPVVTALAVSTQWVLGALLLGLLAMADSRVPGRARAARLLRSGVPAALALGLACLAMTSFVPGGSWTEVEPDRPFLPGLFTLCGGLSTAGCGVILNAGRLEARGRLRPAHVQTRFGGRLLFAGSVSLALLIGAAALGSGSYPPGRQLGVALLLAAGTSGLLGGLSGKPRPSGGLAAVLYALALGSLVLAA